MAETVIARIDVSRSSARRSTSVRTVLALSVIVMAVGSLDRVNLSIAGKAIQD